MAATISSALKWWAQEIPDNEAVRIGDASIRYADLDRWASNIASFLVGKGINRGDRIGVMGASSIEQCALMFGVIRAGAIVSPLSTRLSEREICEFYQHVTPRIVFMDEDQLGKHAGLADVVGWRLALQSINALRDARYVATDWEMDPEDAVGIIATSGSTARPKGVVFTHRSMLSYAAEFAIEEPFTGPGSHALALSPLSTSGGFVQLIEFVSLGATIYFEAGFDAERALKLLECEKIAVFQGVPLFFERIAACPGFATADLSRLKFTSVGGSRVPASLLDTWLKKGCLLRQIYGQTEAGGSSTIMSKRDAVKHPEKAGRGGIFTEVRVINEQGEFLGPNELGQIVLRGPTIMKGYWNDPEATAKTIVNGWLRTGDLGSVDENGYLSFVDRMKDIIISGGLNISAAEVERAIAEFEGVLETAVIGAADAKFGETPLAIVHATGVFDTAALVAHCNRCLADFKVPRYVVIELEPLPRLATGKIAKPALRSKYLPLVASMERVR
ncbi:MAG: fatty-acid--CoA ligase [Hydrocarboniphaga sp.]|uniref:class I adenylate-forming enzyme family protein n=1 Tax=Hydrocarboniphaga sp. TaxID=2033016 RepID=UPI002625079B|nr:AMP-binding protein [Hydrocarboniphaga sp.]MDB5970154.1 fatty-acid--CoA ligase [Hydrocarboniphaga sp.]